VPDDNVNKYDVLQEFRFHCWLAFNSGMSPKDLERAVRHTYEIWKKTPETNNKDNPDE
jgi:hypothetical protein